MSNGARIIGVWLISGAVLLDAGPANTGVTAAQSAPPATFSKPGFLADGQPVPVLSGYGLDGKPVSFDYRAQAKPTVVYVISPFSYFVVRNEDNFATLVRETLARYAFVVLCPADNGRLKEYITKASTKWGKTPVAVVADVSPELREEMKLGMYPRTLVISRESRVVHAFEGAYDKDSLNAQPAEIERFFGVKLPGLLPDR